MSLLVGVLVFIVGLSGFLWPQKTLDFWFLGMLSEDALLERGQTFFRGLGAICMLVGLWVATLG
jgi:hypothetical protein